MKNGILRAIFIGLILLVAWGATGCGQNSSQSRMNWGLTYGIDTIESTARDLRETCGEMQRLSGREDIDVRRFSAVWSRQYDAFIDSVDAYIAAPTLLVANQYGRYYSSATNPAEIERLRNVAQGIKDLTDLSRQACYSK